MPLRRNCPKFIQFIACDRKAKQSSWREIRQAVRCSHEEAMMAGFAIQNKYKHFYLWMYLEDVSYELRFFSLTVVCEEVDLYKPCAPDFMPPILKFYFALTHLWSHCTLSFADCVWLNILLVAARWLFKSAYLGQVSAEKKGSQSQRKSRFKTSWKSKQNNCNFQHHDGDQMQLI